MTFENTFLKYFLKYPKFSALGLSPDVAGATFMAAGATQIVKIKLLMKSKR